MDEVKVSVLEEGIVRVALNRPGRLNALDLALVDRLHVELAQIDADRGCRVVILTGEGKGFCAGLDLNGFGVMPGLESAPGVEQSMAVQQHIAGLMTRLRDLRQPVIAAINGAAAGGGLALALASDIRIAARSSKFATAFIKLGVSGCDMAVSWMLPRLIGASRAWELMLTGRVFSSDEANELGLLTRLVSDEELLPSALEIARQIVANDAFAVWMTKEVMWSNLETSSMQAGIDVENRNQMICLQTAQARSRLGGQGLR
jgi:enoyl-CoA hydratase